MQISAQELAELVGGTVEGDPSVEVSRPGKIEMGQQGEICFLGNPKYEEYAYSTDASILLVSHDFKPKHPLKPTLIRVKDVYQTLAFLMDAFSKTQIKHTGISEKAIIPPSVKLGKNVFIGDFVIIENDVEIGDNTQIHGLVTIGKGSKIGCDSCLYSGVKIYAHTQLGDRCIVHAGAVIGSDGFGFAPQSDGTYKKIHHNGNVIIEADVEIGSNTTIDRGSIGATIIRKGVKLDNLIQVAHNVEIGENTVIAAQTGIAGSTKIGKNCRIGGQVGIVGHIQIGDNVQIQAQSGVAANVPDNAKLYGSPAIAYGDYLRAYALFKRLPELHKRLFNKA